MNQRPTMPYVFDPQPDITTQELAQVVAGLGLGADEARFHSYGEAVRRHFRTSGGEVRTDFSTMPEHHQRMLTEANLQLVTLARRVLSICEENSSGGEPQGLYRYVSEQDGVAISIQKIPRKS